MFLVRLLGLLLPHHVAPTTIDYHFDEVSFSIALCLSFSFSHTSLLNVINSLVNLCICRLLVGWSWEVVVTAFFRWITDTVVLSMEQQVGVRFVILVLILILSALTFYAFKDEDEAYKIDPYAPRTANAASASSPSPSSRRSPQPQPLAIVSNPLQGQSPSTA